MKNLDEPAWAVLRKIAGALGVPVERFFAARSSSDVLSGEDECLRLWSEIKTEEGRRHALEALKAIAELEQTSKLAAS